MGFAIFITVATSGFVAHMMNSASTETSLAAMKGFFARQFGRVWDDPEARSQLADEAARGFHITLELHSPEGKLLSRHGLDDCTRAQLAFDATAVPSGTQVGRVVVCAARHIQFEKRLLIIALISAGCVLWIFAGLIAHKLGTPLVRLAAVTREIGEGRLSARARLGRHHSGEVGALARSINEMAERIERQLEGQRELLAGVSHEIRTPLARLRVVTEILRDQRVEEKSLRNIEREIEEIDDLTGQLLASSRLEFESIDQRELDAVDIANAALERSSLPLELLHTEGKPLKIVGDPTLLERALINLLENAKRHGEGLCELRVRFDHGKVMICTLDEGPGFVPSDLSRVFESFYRGKHSGKGTSSLGLGLSLVRRIVRAHGGKVHAENRSPRGAQVCIEIPTLAPVSPTPSDGV